MSFSHPRHSSFTLVAAIIISAIAGFAMLFVWQSKETEETDRRRGYELAQLVCEQCHSIGQTGSSMNLKAPPFRTLISKFTQEGMQEQLDIALTLPHAPMPAWKFSPEQANNLMTYLLSLENNRPK